MTNDAIAAMVVVLTGVWGGFALLIAGVMRKDRRESDY